MNQPNSFTRLADWDWLLYVAILPFIILRPLEFGWLLLVIPFSWLLQWLGYRNIFAKTAVDWPLRLILLMVIVSLVVTYDFSLSWPKAAGLIYGIAIFYRSSLFATRHKQNVWFLLALFILCGWAIVALSFLIIRWPQQLPFITTLVEPLQSRLVNLVGDGLTAYNANQAAGALLWVAPLTTTLTVGLLTNQFALPFTRWRRWLNAILLVSCLVFVGTLLLTFSRGGLLGLIISMLALPIITVRIAPKSKFLMLGVISILLLFSYFVLAPTSVTNFFAGNSSEALSIESILNSGTSIQGKVSADVTLASRTEIWSRAIYGIQDFPLTGMGMNAFRALVPILYPFFTLPSDIDIAHAHNHWLQVAVDLGLPGLIGFLGLWLGIAASLWQSVRITDNKAYHWLAHAVLTSLIGYFIFGIFDTISLGARPGFVFWLLLGLAIAVHHAANSERKTLTPTA